jgi:hypothetical protein
MNIATALWMLSMSQVVAPGQNIREQISCAPMSLPAPPVRPQTAL